MKRSTTSTFILTLKLNTNDHDERVLEHRFYLASLMKNRLVFHAKKSLSSMRQDKEYRALMNERATLAEKKDPVSKKERSRINQRLKDIRLSYSLSEYAFQDWIKEQQHRYHKHIDSHVAQKIATSVWQSVESVLYRKGKSVHFQKLDNLLSLEGKNNDAGMRFKNGRLCWNGLCIQPQVRKGDWYAREALTHRVKYCRIKRIAMGTTYHYYLQLMLKGTPPKKHHVVDGRVGLDPGVSSEAVFSENGCILTELAAGSQERTHRMEQQARILNRKMERSRRANNPEHYNDDGTIKRIRKPWINSKTYKRDRMQMKTIRRRNAASVRQAEEILANDILANHGNSIITEKMNYQALQRRAKENKITESGKHLSKKRFGKSLAKHAPARFLRTLERKLQYVEKTIFYVDTWKFKASQYDHVVGDYNKVPLSARTKTIGGHLVQRDLYSSFLLFCAKDEQTVDRNLCNRMFPLFLNYQSICIQSLQKEEWHLSSFGLKDFQ